MSPADRPEARRSIISYRKRPAFFFILSAIIIAVVACQVHRAFFCGEPIQEIATLNFYYVYYHKPFLDVVFDSSKFYLEWLPYAITYLCAGLLGLKQDVFLAIQGCGLLVLILYSSFICLGAFRRLIASDLVRLMIALYVGLFFAIGTPEYLRVTDLAYPGVLFVFLMLFFIGEDKPLWQLIPLTLLAGLTICSKTYFVVFVPFFGLLLLHQGWRRRYRSALFSLIICIFLAIDLGKTLLSSASQSVSHTGDIAVSVFVYWASIYLNRLSGAVGPDHGLAYGLFGAAVLLAAGYLLRRAGRDPAALRLTLAMVAANAIAVMALFITVTVSMTPNAPIAYPVFHHFDFQIVDVPRTRHFIFADELIVFIMIWAACFFCRRLTRAVAGYKMAGMAGMAGVAAVAPPALVVLVLGLMISADMPRNNGKLLTALDWFPPPRQLSDWQVFSKYLDVPGYLVPNISYMQSFPTGVTTDPSAFLRDGGGPHPLNDIGGYNPAISSRISTGPATSRLVFKPSSDLDWKIGGFIIFPPQAYYNETWRMRVLCDDDIQFVADNNNIDNISVSATIDHAENLELFLVDAASGTVIAHERRSFRMIPLEKYIGYYFNFEPLLSLSFPPIPDSAGRRFRLIISCDGQSPGLPSWAQPHQGYGPITAVAFDAGGRELGRAVQLSAADSWYRYLKFDREMPLAGIAAIEFRDRDGNPFRLKPLIQFFGSGRLDRDALIDGLLFGPR